jgi:ribosomal protein S18 acetylase RimI-like enzyme
VPIGFYAVSMTATKLVASKNLVDYFFSRQHDCFPSLHIDWIAIRDDRQDQGLGTIVMGRILTIFHELINDTGLCAITLEALNERAEKFYRDLGFVRYGPPVLGRRMLLPWTRVIKTK